MTKQSFLLDPNAQAYTDDEIVGKVNTATANITRSNAVASAAVDLSGKDTDDLSEGSTNKYDTGAPPATLDDIADGSTYKKISDTEKTKLSGIEDGATGDQSGAEIRDAIKALGDTEREIVLTEPESGEYPVIALQRDSSGKLKVDYDDQPVT